MNKLPIGIQAFEIMRTGGFVYVDKTRWIHQLVMEGMYYFLARPRRFGKSLLVSTLKCLFEAKRELFDGLWIAEPGRWEWQPHPVVVVDFSRIPTDTPDILRAGISTHLHALAAEHNLALKPDYIQFEWVNLLLGLARETGQRVVVLIDEYDKPIVDHVGRGADELAIAQANRDILRSFYGVLKDASVAAVQHFVLLTGISRFSRMSVFSALNNLRDISISNAYAAFLGYTQEELETYFEGHVMQMADELGLAPAEVYERLRRHYNGYRFAERDVKVYNPFSILNAFSDLAFKEYWFESGTPTFLVNLLRQTAYDLPTVEGLQVDRLVFTTFEIKHL